MKTKLFAAAAMAAATLSSAAVARPSVVFSPDHRMAFAVPHAGSHFTPNFVRKAASATIYSNIASAYPKGLYFSGEGSSLFGGTGGSQYVAVGFTPTANATAGEVDTAVGVFTGTANAFTVSIYTDASGIPGTALASVSASTDAPFGECCGLLVAKFKAGVALTKGTPYWVAVTLSKKQVAAGSEGAWNLATTDQVDAAPFAFNPNDSGWVASPTTLPPAFAVYSK